MAANIRRQGSCSLKLILAIAVGEGDGELGRWGDTGEYVEADQESKMGRGIGKGWEMTDQKPSRRSYHGTFCKINWSRTVTSPDTSNWLKQEGKDVNILKLT